MSEVVLTMKNIIKDFPGVRALNNVNFEARSGELLALMGENGAGKSTLMKVLSGVWPYPTYEGEIYVNGELKRFTNTKEAEEAGIAIIYQELNLIQELTVAENIFLDRQFTGGFGQILWGRLFAETQNLLNELGIHDFKPTDLVKNLTVGKQQMVEIAKALSINARILVLDEPTSALTDKEVQELFRIIRKLKADGVCMCYISHKMEEIEQIADRIAVLRDGQTIGEVTPIGEITLDQIIQRMVGRDIKDMFPKAIVPARRADAGGPRSRGRPPDAAGRVQGPQDLVHRLQGRDPGHCRADGAGRTELVEGIFGACPERTRGEVYLDGKKLDIRSPKDAIDNGIALLTEDRKALGLFLTQSVAFNTTISSLPTHQQRAAGRDQPQPGAAGRPRLCQAAQRQDLDHRDRHRHAERRQPAEGHPGQVAQCRAQGVHPRRADPRHRHRRQGRDLQAPEQPGRARRHRDHDLLRAARDHGHVRPRHGDVRGPGRVRPSREAATKEAIMSYATGSA